MVIVRARVASSQTRFSPTMTLYSTMIPGYCRVQLKKKWQTCHQVPRCWPHSTVCRSPGHGIGRPGLMVTSHITDWYPGHGLRAWCSITGAGAISASGMDVTPSKMAEGSGNCACACYGASSLQPILLTYHLTEPWMPHCLPKWEFISPMNQWLAIV